jgi:hypothetical protein
VLQVRSPPVIPGGIGGGHCRQSEQTEPYRYKCYAHRSLLVSFGIVGSL